MRLGSTRFSDKRQTRRCGAALSVLVALCWSPLAIADTAQCEEATKQGLALWKVSQLSEAISKLNFCASESCSHKKRQECGRWVKEVNLQLSDCQQAAGRVSALRAAGKPGEARKQLQYCAKQFCPSDIRQQCKQQLVQVENSIAGCVSALNQARRLRKGRQLKAAREKLVQCSALQCSARIREECIERTEDVEREIPSVIPKVIHGKYSLSRIRVEMDGKLLTESLDGTAFEVDPGFHQFRFFRDGQLLNEKPRKVTVNQGQKNQQVPIELPEDIGDIKKSPSRVPEWVLGSVAVAGLASFAIVGGVFYGRQSTLEETCGQSNTCTPDQVESLDKGYLAADILLGIGLGAGAAALITFLARPEPDLPDDAVLALQLAPTPYGAGAVLTGAF